MKLSLSLLAPLAALTLMGCASTSVMDTWKTPTPPSGPVQKVAVIAVEQRGLARIGFENRFVRELKARGQAAIPTHDLLALPDIKADKEAAAAKLAAAGVDSVLIVRLAEQRNYNRSIRATSERYASTVTGIDDTWGWYNYYSVAFIDMSTVWSVDKKTVYLDSSLYDLGSRGHLWSAVTETVLKDGTDPLPEADALSAMVVKRMAKDEMIK
jgi:hypothetical protein